VQRRMTRSSSDPWPCLCCLPSHLEAGGGTIEHAVLAMQLRDDSAMVPRSAAPQLRSRMKFELWIESESDNATEGVIWKARDLWSAPVEWSNHGMQAQKSSESMQSSAATMGWHPPSGGCCVISVRQCVVVKGCAAA